MSTHAPPFLLPGFSAGFAKAICTDTNRWQQLSEVEFRDELLSLTMPIFGLLRVLDDRTITAIVAAFYREISDSGGHMEIGSPASIAFFEECQVKLKREFYGERGSRELFDPRLEGRHRDEFNRACGLLQRLVSRIEGEMEEPYYCPNCSVFGEFQLLVFTGRKRVCLGCVADYNHITNRHFLITRSDESNGSNGYSIPAGTHGQDSHTTMPVAKTLEPDRRAILHACLDAARELGAKFYWVAAAAIIDDARKQLQNEVNPRAVRRELVLHTLDHPERHRFPVDRVGAYLFELMPPDRFKLLPDPLEELPPATGGSATNLRPVEFDGVFRLRIGGEFRMLEQSKVVPPGLLQPLEEFVKRKMVTGVVVVASGQVYQGSLSARVLIGRIYQTKRGSYVVK